jgi:hypothetical protein
LMMRPPSLVNQGWINSVFKVFSRVIVDSRF